jgi:hypothetical protein
MENWSSAHKIVKCGVTQTAPYFCNKLGGNTEGPLTFDIAGWNTDLQG